MGDPARVLWLMVGAVAWWLGATGAGVRRDLLLLEEENHPGGDYALASFLRRLQEDSVLLSLRIRLARGLAAVIIPLSLAAAVPDLGWGWGLAALGVGWWVAAQTESTGGGILVRRWGRLRGGAGYAAWSRILLGPARVLRPLLRWGRRTLKGGERALVLAETRAALTPGGARLGMHERRFLRRLLASTNILVADIMTTWGSVDRIPQDSTPREAAAAAHRSGHSRLPVLQEERVVGLVTAKDLLARLHSEPTGGMSSVMRTPYFVRQEITVKELLEELQEARAHFATVVDGLGRVVGIVTMEDVLEEIVGELYDEREREEAS